MALCSILEMFGEQLVFLRLAEVKGRAGLPLLPRVVGGRWLDGSFLIPRHL